MFIIVNTWARKATVSGWTTNKKKIHYCTTDSINNTLQIYMQRFYFWTICLTKAKEPHLPYYFIIAVRRTDRCVPFPRAFVQSETLSCSWFEFDLLCLFPNYLELIFFLIHSEEKYFRIIWYQEKNLWNS